jgi:hypothetical protein
LIYLCASKAKTDIMLDFLFKRKNTVPEPPKAAETGKFSIAQLENSDATVLDDEQMQQIGGAKTHTPNMIKQHDLRDFLGGTIPS